jgi:hypothetical protein
LGGTFRLSGPSSRSGSFKAIAALPGKLVAPGAGGARGMKKGRYTATVTQGGRRTNARTTSRSACASHFTSKCMKSFEPAHSPPHFRPAF